MTDDRERNRYSHRLGRGDRTNRIGNHILWPRRSKNAGWYGGSGLATSMRTFTEHLHLPATLAFLVIAGEFFSGIGLIVGLFSRIAALVIVLTMVGAIATVHFRFGLFLNWFGDQEGHGIEYHLLAIALALVVVVKGAGAFSLDHLVHEHVPGLEQSVAAQDQ